MSNVKDYKQHTATVRIHVSELKIGMYVSKLDCDWLETPFLVQGFVLQSLGDIDLLAQYSEYVWVDLARDVARSNPALHSTIQLDRNSQAVHKIPNRVAVRNSIDLHRKSGDTAAGVIRSLRMGDLLKAEDAQRSVRQCMQNVVSDPDIALLVNKIHQWDDYLVNHSLSVCTLSMALGKFIGMMPFEMERLGVCALMHDVGKIKLSPQCLQQKERMSEEQTKEYQLHCVLGRNILSSSKNLYHGAVDVAYSHHEQINGDGYPRQIKSTGLSEYSKIVAICNAYDKLTDPSIGESMPSNQAMIQLISGRNTLFDAKLVDHFQRMVGLYPPGSIVELLNGCVAIVLEKNYRYQHLPRIIVVLDTDKNPTTEKIIDLTKVESGQIDNDFLILRACVDGAFGVSLKDHLEKGLVLKR